MASTDEVLVDQVDATLILTLNRPDKLNAINYRMIGSLLEQVHRASTDDSIRAVMLKGSGRAFSAGDDTSQPLRKAIAPGFMPDNIHWDGSRLILAGMQFDEPACGGTRKIVDGKADDMRCHRGYVVAQLDPRRMSYQVLAASGPNPDFNGVSSAVIVRGELWMGSYQADRIAHRALRSAGSQ